MYNYLYLRWIDRALAQKWKMTIVWIAIVVIGYVCLKMTPSVYRSEGKLFVRLGRENVTLDPTANLGQGQITAVPLTRETELNTVVETLRSRMLAEHVVNTIGAERILADQYRWYESILPQRMSPSERAVGKLTKMIEVGAVRKSNLVKVACDARDTELAREAVGLYVDRFLEHHRSLNRNPAAHGFFAEQTKLALARLKAAEDEYLTFKNQSEVVSIEDQKRLLLAQSDILAQEIKTAETQLLEAQAAIKSLQSHLTTRPERLVTETTRGMANQAADGIRDQLYTLQLREKELSARYTDEHARLREVREQLAAAEAVHKAENVDRSQVREGRSKAFEQAELLLVERESEALSLAARVASRKPQLVDVQTRLIALNEAEAKHERLARELELHRNSYLQYAQSLEQARIDASLATERISNISIAEQPYASHKPVSPNRPLIAGVIIIFATFAAAAVGLASDHLRTDLPTTTSFATHGSREVPVISSSLVMSS